MSIKKITASLCVALSVLLGASTALAYNTLTPNTTSTVKSWAFNYGTSTRWGSACTTHPVLMIADNSAGKTAVRNISSSTILTSYVDTNLPPYADFFSTVNRSESTFIHAADPACLSGVPLSSTSIFLTIAKDGRITNGTLSDADAYYVYQKTGVGNWSRIYTGGTSATQIVIPSLSPSTTYQFRVASHSASLGELSYGQEISVATASAPAFALLHKVTTKTQVTTPGDSLVLNARVLATSGTNDLVLYLDKNHDRDFLDAGESVAMTLDSGAGVSNGYATYDGIISAPVTHSATGFYGFAWYVASTSHSSLPLPSSGTYYTTNVNNRICDLTYRVYAVDRRDTTFTRCLQNKAREYYAAGYDGLFIDDCGTYMDAMWDCAWPQDNQLTFDAGVDSLIVRVDNAMAPGFTAINDLGL